MKKKNLTKTQEGYKLGIVGQHRGSCCMGWCLDCDFIRKDFNKRKKKN